jgi:MYXO-CTERM domain-containing protein
MHVKPFVVAIAAIAGLSVAMPPRPARACSHPSISQAPYLHFPAPGSTGVPTNVVLTVYRSTYEDTLSGFVLRDDLGATVATSHTKTSSWGTGDLGTTAFRVTPAAALAPSTRYQIVATVDGAEQLLGDVTTGDGPDDVAPAAPLGATITSSAPHHCESGFQCCDVGVLTGDVEVTIPAGDEPLVYSVRDLDGNLLAEDLPAPLTGMVVCNGYPSFRDTPGPDRLPDFLVADEVKSLQLFARDLAGHESAPFVVAHTVDCARPDQGTGPLPPKTPAGEPDGGCAVGGRGSAPVGAALGLVALLALAARRRRR